MARKDGRQARIAEWFKDHRATRDVAELAGRPIERLLWGRPDGSSIYRVEYLSIGGRLFVAGDLGEAVYCVYGTQTLAWWARCDLSYFSGKCEASEHGRGYRSWDQDKAREYLTGVLSDECLGDDNAPRRDKFARLGGWDAIGSRDEWSAWLMENGYEVWGEPWEYGNVGMRVDDRCEAHLMGLKMAVKQLAEREAATRSPATAGA